MTDRVAAEERLRKALAVALHECLPDTADDRMHPTGEDADEPFCEYLSHALIARITEPTWLAQNDLPVAAAQADTAPGGGLDEAIKAMRAGKRWHEFSRARQYEVHGGETHFRRDAFEEGWYAALAAPSRDAGGWTFEGLTGDGWAIIGPDDQERHGDWSADGYGRAIALDRDDAERIVNALNRAPGDEAGVLVTVKSLAVALNKVQAEFVPGMDDERTVAVKLYAALASPADQSEAE